MPVKFESISFTTKDVVMIVGAVISSFTFYNKIDNRFNEFELKIQQINNRTDINEIKFNAKIDAMKHTNNGAKVPKDNIYFVACVNDRRLEVVKIKKA
ncbi:hypothetical protein UFOVP87_56 [uncultured Caudovirales phage]|uniref:Uncharacterized protein n=1 Tax=uncultured Caudovirales phage TaxID=2100421 RepID=A0A6J5L1Q6_9CAUD|nr:hypothetical protein UFOVP87_56 [uncultured Caudovirales phage]